MDREDTLGRPFVLNSLDELKEKASAEYDILSKTEH